VEDDVAGPETPLAWTHVLVDRRQPDHRPIGTRDDDLIASHSPVHQLRKMRLCILHIHLHVDLLVDALLSNIARVVDQSQPDST
jgi:hypothetical protein